MSVTIEPTILYFGSAVVLISALNEDGTANLAPMSPMAQVVATKSKITTPVPEEYR